MRDGLHKPTIEVKGKENWPVRVLFIFLSLNFYSCGLFPIGRVKSFIDCSLSVSVSLASESFVGQGRGENQTKELYHGSEFQGMVNKGSSCTLGIAKFGL